MPVQTKNKKYLCYCGEQFNDYQRKDIRNSVCRNNPAKFKHNGEYYCIFHYPNEAKKSEFALAFYDKINSEDYLFYGTWFPDIVDFSNHTFNKRANFAWTTFTKEASFKDAQFKDNCQFLYSVFRKKVSFNKTVFSSNTIEILPINFYSVIFEDSVDFDYSKFEVEAKFDDAKFLIGYSSSNEIIPDFPYFICSSFSSAVFEKEVSFKQVKFGKEDNWTDSFSFNKTIFDNRADFQDVEFLINTYFSSFFKGTADFRNTIVKNSIRFEESSFNSSAIFSSKDGNYKSWNFDGLNFSLIHAEKPERITFRSLKLKPDSFINTDTRKFEFTDIDWKIKNFAFDWSRFKDFKFWTSEAKKRRSQYHILSIAYNRLATNAEENNRYGEASNFRFTANEIHRIGKNWYGRLPSLSWLYKWSSRYGENWQWALFILILILAAFVVYYYYAYFQICPKGSEIKSQCIVRTMNWIEAIHQSLMTASLQNVEYRKSVLPEQDLVILFQKILSPIQAALLALAIRRKFMR